MEYLTQRDLKAIRLALIVVRFEHPNIEIIEELQEKVDKEIVASEARCFPPPAESPNP